MDKAECSNKTLLSPTNLKKMFSFLSKDEYWSSDNPDFNILITNILEFWDVRRKRLIRRHAN